jgi:hypothetical protein
MHQGCTMRQRLRLFTGEEPDVLTMPAPQITVRLRDITQALTDAARRNRSWLQDFEDDEVRVSADLYEVLAAYLQLRPGA